MTITDSNSGASQARQLITDGWDNWGNIQKTDALSVKEGDSVVLTISGTMDANDYDPEVLDDDNGGTWDNQAFFDFDGKVLDSINVYKWVYTGAKEPVKVATVDDTSYELIYQTTPELPKTINVNLNTGTTLDAPVTWDATQVEALKTAAFGEYVINGTVGEFTFEDNGKTVKVEAGTYQTTCTVTVTGKNYVENGSFETGDATGWTLTNYLGEDVGWPKVDSNSSNAKTGRYYYTAWSEDTFDFSIDQTLSAIPESGKYTLFAWYQGTGIKELYDRSKLYARITYKDSTEKLSEASVEIHNVWKDFYQAKIDGLILNGNVASVSLGTRLACSGIETGAWVVVDDISLMRIADLSADEEKVGAVTASPKTTVKVAKVKKITAKKKNKTTVTVKIKKVSGAKGYQIRYATKKSFKGSKAKLTKETTYNLKKLKKGKTYYIKVRAYKTSNGKKVYGKYSKTVKVKL